MIQRVKKSCKTDKTIRLFHLINSGYIIGGLFIKNFLQNKFPQINQFVLLRYSTDKTDNVS